jgi:hypothetical protein
MGGQIKSTNLKQEMKGYFGSEIPDINIIRYAMQYYITLHLTRDRSGTLPVCLGR